VRVRLPIGLQDFPGLRAGGYLYVDKTRQIAQLLQASKHLFFARPRRFGKSLLISTLAAIYQGRKELFTDLWIHDNYSFDKYPVIRIDFSNINFSDKSLNEGIFDWLCLQAAEFDCVLTSENARDALRELIFALAKTAPVVILVDEYDKAITDHLLEPDKRREHQALLKGFYGVLKPMDGYIHKVFLTGVSKIGKLSLFSDLNNLEDISLDPVFATLCGYTKPEIEDYFDNFLQAVADVQQLSLPETWSLVKNWYNGYSWDAVNRVYCPFSFLLFLSQKQFKSFWYETGTPSFLLAMIRSAQLNPLGFESEAIDSNTLVATDIENLDAISLMFQTGYLTIASQQQTAFGMEYQLAYPNQEVRQAFSQGLLREYSGQLVSQVGTFTVDVRRALLKRDWPRVFERINMMYAAIPYEIFPREEIYVHSLLHLMFLTTGIKTTSQVQTALGRMDMLIEAPDFSVIFELKTRGSAAEALAQIDERRYSELLPGQTVVKIDVLFDLAEKRISDWLIE
jgi:hypothetical protein